MIPKGRWFLYLLLGTVLSVTVLCSTQRVYAQTPSYSDRWNNSSPFFNLRNNEIDTPESPTEPKVEEPDTPPVKAPESPSETTNTDATQESSEQSTDSDPRKQATNESNESSESPSKSSKEPASKTNEEKTQSNTDDNSTMAAEESSPPERQVTQSGSADEQEPEDEPSTDRNQTNSNRNKEKQEIKSAPELPDPVRSENASSDTLPARTASAPETSPRNTLMSNSGETVSLQGSSERSVSEASDDPSQFEYPSLPSWTWLTAGFAALVGLMLLYYLFNRSSVEEIEPSSDNQTHYFQEQFERKSQLPSDKKSVGREPAQRSQSKPSPSADRGSGSPVPDASEAGVARWSNEDLESAGIDPAYKSVINMYFSEHLNAEEIAQQTDFGKGEVGLVVDMVTRLEEEQSNARRT